jgi:hypothetical protein
VCFSVAPDTSNVFLLLGQESRSQKWCDFGGQVNDRECVEGAASREFCEESLFAITLDQTASAVNLQEYRQLLKQALQNGDYFLKLDILQDSTAEVAHPVHVYYLVEVPWQPNVKDLFNHARDDLVTKNIIDHPALCHGKVDEHWLEKSKVRWWSLDRLKDVLRHNGKFRQQRFRSSFVTMLKIMLPMAFENNH